MSFARSRAVALAVAIDIASIHGGAAAQPSCLPMNLPVVRVDGGPSQYVDFCNRHPSACELSGASRVEWTPEFYRVLMRVNAAVNAEVVLTSDMDNLGLEERWDFPVSCRGDCEDFVLEKRERLVARGLPRGALTIAFAFHESDLFAHAVLLAETSAGTLVLDNLTDEIRCWNESPYRFTRRERPDGSWLRFEAFAPGD